MNSTTGKVIRYFALPGIIPRLQRLFMSGFACLSFYMASVMNLARLLPDNHPYLNAANFGRFGIHHVLFQSWRNLEFKRRNTDQIIIFFTLASGVVLLLLQVIIFLLALFVPVASAGIGAEFTRFFVTQNPEHDLAFMFLDRVFGMQGIFESRVTTEANWPTNFHEGLHELFGYYNTGLAIVAFLLILYFVITLTGETAETGTPFGKRFNKAMAPARLIIAIGLLVPITSGMSMAQIGTLYVAKWGSSLATNGWLTFLDEVKGTTILGDPDTLVVTPKPPMVNSLVEFMFVAVVCRYAYEYSSQEQPDNNFRFMIRPYVILPDDGSAILGGGAAADLTTILGLTNNRNVKIVFGHQNPDWYPELPSYVYPLCGEIVLDLQDVTEPGALYVQNAYLINLINGLWNDAPNNTYAQNMVNRDLTMVPNRSPNAAVPSQAFINDTFDYFNDQTLNDIQQGVLESINNGVWDEDFTKYGWGGASIWYNTIAKINGSLISSTYNLPVARRYPDLMENVRDKKRAQNNSVTDPDRFKPELADGTAVFESNEAMQFARLFYESQVLWQQKQDANSGNFFKDGINMLLGLQGLIDMRDNADVHPLAQLVGIGRSLIESAKQNFGYTAATWVGGMAKEPSISTVAKNAHSFFKTVMMFGLSIGFVLFYVLPTLPFIYFFVAVTNWVKTIFEAMVGLPLWALSHIRIEGDGLPGPAAMNGYYLIFEIFVNPILIVFGMLAGISLFSAQVVVLHEIWGLVMSSVTGIDPATVDNVSADKVGSVRYVRGVLDKFFYTVMYAVFVYMIGMGSFKLVDTIPDKILRWMGTSVKSFNETAESMATQLMSKSYQASESVIQGADGVMNQMLLRNR